MSTLIRKVKSDIEKKALSEVDFYTWLQGQLEGISEYVSKIKEIKEGKNVVSLNKIYELASGFTEFYTTHIAILSVYEDLRDKAMEKSSDFYDKLYLKIKEDCSNPESSIGNKYKKKSPTQEEISKEVKQLPEYEDYKILKDQFEDYNRRYNAQNNLLKGLGKLDSIISIFQRGVNTEVKYLYLE
jgi:hypothetical protein